MLNKATQGFGTVWPQQPGSDLTGAETAPLEAYAECPACGSPGYRKVAGWRRSGLSIVKCRSCHLWRLAGLSDLEYTTEALSTWDSSKPLIQRQERIRHREYEQVSSIISGCRPQGGRLLDVGAGRGGFLRTHLAHSTAPWDVAGVDCALTDRPETEFRLMTGTIADVPKAERFDVISFLDVFCVMADPCTDLRIARTLLNPGGIVVIEEANMNFLRYVRLGPMALLRSGRWNSFTPGARRFYFGLATLARMLNACGFRTHAALPGFVSHPGSDINSRIRTAADSLARAVHRTNHRIHLSARMILVAEPDPNWEREGSE